MYVIADKHHSLQGDSSHIWEQKRNILGPKCRDSSFCRNLFPTNPRLNPLGITGRLESLWNRHIRQRMSHHQTIVIDEQTFSHNCTIRRTIYVCLGNFKPTFTGLGPYEGERLYRADRPSLAIYWAPRSSPNPLPIHSADSQHEKEKKKMSLRSHAQKIPTSCLHSLPYSRIGSS